MVSDGNEKVSLPLPVVDVSIRYNAVLGISPRECTPAVSVQEGFPSAITRYLVSDTVEILRSRYGQDRFPSAITRYLVSDVVFSLLYPVLIGFPSAITRYLVPDPTRKTPPLTSGGGNGLHTPRRIDHIPTFASLNHDKNTRSTHYTPNAGIEFSQAGFAPPHVNPVQKWA